jgi:competence protein ComEC
MHTEQRYLDPGVWDTSFYLHEQGIGAIGATDAARASPLGYGKPSLSCRLRMLQIGADSRILALAELPLEQRLPQWLRLSDADTSMLTAMLTGDRTYLQRSTRVGFERTGSFHLLVVSGMHLAIFASVIFVAARKLRLTKLAATAATLILAFAYALFTGFGQPVQRSFWMVALYLIGRLIFRERHALQALGLASLCLVAANPRALTGSSLQMTLLSVVAIGGIAAPLVERSFGPYLRGTRNLWLLAIDPSLPVPIAEYRVTLRLIIEHLARWTGPWFARCALPWLLIRALQAIELLIISIIVELVMALPMAVYFHRITVLGLPVNFLIVPFLGLLLPAALATFAVLLISPTLAVLPATLAAGLLHIVAGIVTFFSDMHAGDYRIPAPPSPRIILWIGLIALAVWLVRRARWGPQAALAALLASALITVAPQAVVHRAGALEVTAIDVGQGDSILVITPGGRSLLVDAGGIAGAPKDSSFNMGEDVVSPVLWSRGIQRLDAVAITHAHSDHIGGMPAVLANFRPREVWVGNNPVSQEYAALTAEAAALGIPLVAHRAGDAWTLGSGADAVRVQALWPSASYIPRAEPTNNDSLVLRLSYGATSALLEGDAEAPAEQAMLAHGLAHADLLKVGHHGSRSSTIPQFLAAVAPRYGVISVGRRNFYGHPRHEILEELETARVQTYRTDMLGATTFYLDGKQVTGQAWAATQAGIFGNNGP